MLQSALSLTWPTRDYELACDHWAKFKLLVQKYPLLHDTMRYCQFDADSAVAVSQFVRAFDCFLTQLLNHLRR